VKIALNDMKTFGERVSDARKRKGLSQDQIAQAAGVSRSAIAQWETGRVENVDARALRGAARALGVSVDWLLDGEAVGAAQEEAAAYHAGPSGGLLLECWSDLTEAQRRELLERACADAEHNRAVLTELRGRD
jgi:transcriptional regulator with XRE-family HTH domain